MLLMWVLLPLACSDEEAPVSNPPVLTILPAEDITRISASVTGSIQLAAGTSVKEFGLAYSTVSSMPEEDTKRITIPLAASQNTYTLQLTGLQPNTIYYCRFYATGGVNEVTSTQLTFSTKDIDVPMLNELGTSGLTDSSVTLSCQLIDEGGSEIQSYGFAYRKTDESEEVQRTADNKDAAGRFSLTLTGLDPAADYEVRAYAINSAGTGYSQPIALTTQRPDAPVVKLESATADHRSLILSASLADGQDITEKGFYVSREDRQQPSESDKKYVVDLKGNFEYVISEEIEQNTTYYVWAYAVNKGITVGYSDRGMVKTERSEVPQMGEVTAMVTGEKSLTLKGIVADNGGQPITEIGYGFKASSDAQETRTVLPIEKLAADQTFEFVIDGLTPGTTCYVRTYATNQAGTGYSDYASLSTDSQKEPTLTLAVDETTSTSIALTATVSDKGGTSATLQATGFVYSTTNAAPTLADGTKVEGSQVAESFSGVLQNLTQGTKYYVRAYASNDTQTGYSEVKEVTTARSTVPTLGAVTVSNIQEGSAEVEAQVIDNGGNTIEAIGFAYKLANGGDTHISVPLTDLTANNTFKTTLRGLTASTTYQVRAYAVNRAGNGYGSYTSFTTADQVAPQLTIALDSASVAGNSFHVEATISSVGSANASIIESGFCWSTTNEVPTVADSKKQVTASGRAFAATIDGLKGNTTYYVRAYAVNEQATGYSTTVIKVTTPTSGLPDIDDNPSPEIK